LGERVRVRGSSLVETGIALTPTLSRFAGEGDLI
jgi:hypothetical protein